MRLPAVLTAVARVEAAEAVRWLARRKPGAARGLRQSIADAARTIGNRPFVGRQHAELLEPHFRLWSLVSFPYLLVYDPRPEPPQILRVVHTARDLGPLLAGNSEPDS